MNHVLAGIKIGIKKTNDLNEVKVSGVTVMSEGAAQAATMNAIDGTLSNFTGQGEEISSNTDLTVTTTTQYLPTFMVLPTGVNSKVKIDVTINGSQYTVSSSALTLLKGNIHEFVLSFNNIGEMSLTTVKVNGYTTSNNLEANLYPKSPSHGEVYAVNANGELISADFADETCIAAALIVGDHKFWIAKERVTAKWGSSSILQV